MSKLLIKNWTIIDPANKINDQLDLLIENWKISKISKSIKSESWTKTIDAKWKIVTPWFIDIHVHLREPWREDKETIHTASRSAAKWWITSVVAMPNTSPVADNQTVLEYVLAKAKRESLVNIFVSWSITKWEKGKELAEIWEMKQTWAVAVTDDGHDIQNLAVYRKALQYCKTHDMPIVSHSEDKDLAKWWHMHEWEVSTRLWIPWIPTSAEDTAVWRIICLVEEIWVPLHFTHVSTQWSVDLIKLAQDKWLQITADATPHHFSLTDENCAWYNTDAKVNPPLRPELHRQAILKALKDNTISVIATDHAPHLWTEKCRDFQDAPFWMVWFETMLPLIITNLVNTKVLSLNDAIAKITCNPAKILWLKKWSLSIWSDADITIFDAWAKQKINKIAFESKGQNSPFHWMTLNWVITETIVWWNIVVENWKISE